MAAVIFLRPATHDDVEPLYVIHRAALGEYVKETWGWDEAAQAEHFRREFPLGLRQVICVDGQMAGYLDEEQHTDCLYLLNIAIAPQFQCRGIGTGLIFDLLQRAAEQSLPVRLQVLKVNRAARALYERLGFQKTGETKTHNQMLSLYVPGAAESAPPSR